MFFIMEDANIKTRLHIFILLIFQSSCFIHLCFQQLMMIIKLQYEIYNIVICYNIFHLKKQSAVFFSVYSINEANAGCEDAFSLYLSLSLSSLIPQPPAHYLIDLNSAQQHGHNWLLMCDWGQWWYEEQQIDTITDHLSSGIYWLGLCRGNQGEICHLLKCFNL